MGFFKKKKKPRKEPVDPFEDMAKMINEMMKSLMDTNFLDEDLFEKIQPGKPMVYGFSLKVGPEGKIKIDKFGNVEPTKQELRVKEEREPLVDVMNKEKEITVIAELPGVSKKDINLSLADKGKTLIIDVPNKFYKEVSLPEKAKMGKAHYKNGVLEVTLPKTGKRGKKIKVE